MNDIVVDVLKCNSTIISDSTTYLWGAPNGYVPFGTVSVFCKNLLSQSRLRPYSAIALFWPANMMLSPT